MSIIVLLVADALNTGLAMQRAANESKASIEKALQGTDMVFVTVSVVVQSQDVCTRGVLTVKHNHSVSLMVMMV